MFFTAFISLYSNQDRVENFSGNVPQEDADWGEVDVP